MTDQEANEIERREWAQEHESLSAFIEKVEASGEPSTYKRAGDPRMLADLDAYQERYEAQQTNDPGGRRMLFSARNFFQEGWKANEASRGPVYTQQQLDDAVRAERERIAAVCESLGFRWIEEYKAAKDPLMRAKAHAAGDILIEIDKTF